MGNNLEEKMDAGEIVGEAGMSNRPEFYSGRGAISDDLNDKLLEKIYKGIEKEYGEEIAKQFVYMVRDIPKLSATDFLLTLYRLESYDWKWDKKLLGNGHGIDVGPDRGDGSREEIGLATIANVLCKSSERDETGYIRGQFLQRHGIKIPKSKDSWY